MPRYLDSRHKGAAIFGRRVDPGIGVNLGEGCASGLRWR
jgi:hypothetical protein